MKATKETRQLSVTGGYLTLERSVKIVKGIKKVTRWHVAFDSRIGY